MYYNEFIMVDYGLGLYILNQLFNLLDSKFMVTALLNYYKL